MTINTINLTSDDVDTKDADGKETGMKERLRVKLILERETWRFEQAIVVFIAIVRIFIAVAVFAGFFGFALGDD